MTGHFASVCRTKSKQEHKKRTHGSKVDGENLTVWRMVKIMNMLLLWDSVNHRTGVDKR